MILKICLQFRVNSMVLYDMICLLIYFLISCETVSTGAQAGLELILWPRQTLNIMFLLHQAHEW